MDHDNCPLTFFKALLNIIGGKGAISNINYHYYSIIIIIFENIIGSDDICHGGVL